MLNRRPRRWSIPVVCAALLAVSIVPAAGAADGAGQPGSWQPHKYDFHFMGFTSTYSCDGLADKLQLLLRVVGARPDAKVIPLCARGSGVPDKLAEASLKFSSLQLADANAPVAAASASDSAPGVWRMSSWRRDARSSCRPVIASWWSSFVTRCCRCSSPAMSTTR